MSVKDEYEEFLNGVGEDLEKDNTCNDVDAVEYDHEQHEAKGFGEEDDYHLEYERFLASQDTTVPLDVAQVTPLLLSVSKTHLTEIPYTPGFISTPWKDEASTPSIKSLASSPPVNPSTPFPERCPNRVDRFGGFHQLKAIIDVVQQNCVKGPSPVGVQTSSATPKVEKIQNTPVPEPKQALEPGASVFTPTAPMFTPTAAVVTPRTTTDAAPVQNQSPKQEKTFGVMGSAHTPTSKPKKTASSLCQFCKTSNHTHTEDACGMNPKNICRFCDKPNHTHTEEKCHRIPKNQSSKASGKPSSFCGHCGDPDHKLEECVKYEYFMQMNNEIKFATLCSATPEVKPSQQSPPVAQSTGVTNGNDKGGRSKKTPRGCNFCCDPDHKEEYWEKSKENARLKMAMYGTPPQSAASVKKQSPQQNSKQRQHPQDKKTGGVIGSKYAPGNAGSDGTSRNGGNGGNDGKGRDGRDGGRGGNSRNGRNGGNGDNGSNGRGRGQRWNNNRRY